MKKLLLTFLTFVSASFVQASITEEDAKLILDKMGANKYHPTGMNTEKLARSLARFVQACKSNTPDMTLNVNWHQRAGLPGDHSVGFNLRSTNCFQLADIMKDMAKDTEKYDSSVIERLEKSADEISIAR
jgi:hypothetical protein